ncbi:MAG: hypothetical protein EOO26_06510 [Comamonadaceae bacterium]|nr:MAG: hypothetical protein EOO26_06510 [Comamonadaceae bacterium]
MQPILDLRKAAGDAFTYSLSASVRSSFPRPIELFNSTERCLYDAGKSLQNYFDSVHIRYDGISLGSYPVLRLVQDPLGLFEELMQRLIATFRMRNRSHPRAARPKPVTMAVPTTGDRHDS